MTAAIEFRQIRLSRETRDWCTQGAAALRQIAKDWVELDPEPFENLAFTLQTIVDEWDAAKPEVLRFGDDTKQRPLQ